MNKLVLYFVYYRKFLINVHRYWVNSVILWMHCTYIKYKTIKSYYIILCIQTYKRNRPMIPLWNSFMSKNDRGWVSNQIHSTLLEKLILVKTDSIFIIAFICLYVSDVRKKFSLDYVDNWGYRMTEGKKFADSVILLKVFLKGIIDL